jgi:hypothetical protein
LKKLKTKRLCHASNKFYNSIALKQHIEYMEKINERQMFKELFCDDEECQFESFSLFFLVVKAMKLHCVKLKRKGARFA